MTKIKPARQATASATANTTAPKGTSAQAATRARSTKAKAAQAGLPLADEAPVALPAGSETAGAPKAKAAKPAKAVKAEPVRRGAKKAAKAPAAEADKDAAKAVPASKVSRSAKAGGAGLPQAGAKQQAAGRRARPVAEVPLRVFQVYREAWQRELLEPGFAPVNATQAPMPLSDLPLWSRLQQDPAARAARMWGVVSWRYGEQVGMPGADWLAQMQAKPGADIYFSVLDSHGEAVFHNGWLQAEVQVPGFLEVARAFLQVNGLEPSELDAIAPSAFLGGGTLFVASHAFWAAYLPWVHKLVTVAEQRMPPALREKMNLAPEAGSAAAPQGCLALLVERLLPVFLRTEGRAFKAVRIGLPQREKELNVHEKLLREMKDVAHRTQSPWLAACWVNYRNLYLSQTRGKAWAQQHLRAITPRELKFA